jgi:AcrR family transcriptional regulator
MQAADPGRPGQRKRTRRAIVEAAMELLGEGANPSVGEIAGRAEVSRRTVYSYFPTLDQLLVDASLGLISEAETDRTLAPAGDDAEERITALAGQVMGMSDEVERLGRRVIALTVDGARPPSGGPRRGYRRVEWIESALEPIRPRLGDAAYERLVSALAMVIGFEPLLVARDTRGLTSEQAAEVSTWAARALLRAALEDEEPGS